MNFGIPFWRRGRTLAVNHDHVPQHIRKIWVARPVSGPGLPEARGMAGQQTLYDSPEALVLRGESTLHTAVHPRFATPVQAAQEVWLLLWVPFRRCFSSAPVVSVELVSAPAGYLVSAKDVAEDGFRIAVRHWGEGYCESITISWRAAGFPVQARVLDIENA